MSGTTATCLGGGHCGEQHHFPPEHALLLWLQSAAAMEQAEAVSQGFPNPCTRQSLSLQDGHSVKQPCSESHHILACGLGPSFSEEESPPEFFCSDEILVDSCLNHP